MIVKCIKDWMPENGVCYKKGELYRLHMDGMITYNAEGDEYFCGLLQEEHFKEASWFDIIKLVWYVLSDAFKMMLHIGSLKMKYDYENQ